MSTAWGKGKNTVKNKIYEAQILMILYKNLWAKYTTM